MKAMNEMTRAPRVLAINRQQAGRQLSGFKKRLLDTALPNIGNPGQLRLLRLAADEAEALASLTPFPLLVLPELLREKLDAARRYVERRTRFQSPGG